MIEKERHGSPSNSRSRNFSERARAALNLYACHAENLHYQRYPMAQKGDMVHVVHPLLPPRTPDMCVCVCVCVFVCVCVCV